MVDYPPQGSGGVGATSLNQLTDVTIVAPLVDEVLKYNGVEWINGAGATVSAGPGTTFYLSDVKIIPAGIGPQTKALETLQKTPSGTPEVDESVTVNNSTDLIDQYLYNTALGVTTIDAGDWTFDTYTYVDNAAGTSVMVQSIYRVIEGTGTITIAGAGVNRTATVAGGTPFVAADFNADITQTGYIQTPNAIFPIVGFTDDHTVTIQCLATYTNEAGVAYSLHRYLFQAISDDINNLAVGLKTTDSVQISFAINTTDKLAARYFGRTNNLGNITIHLVHSGTQHYTHILSPLATKHNDLAGLQGGVANQYYHLTQAEYTGSGTGTFIRQNNSTLTGTTTMGNITATTINKVDITTPITVATLTIADGKTLNVADDTIISGASGTVVTEIAFGQAATAGAATTFSRGDHTHGTPPAPPALTPAASVVTEQTFGQASAIGISLNYAREDHTHGTMAAPVFSLLSDALRNTKGGTDALRDNVAGTDNSAFGYNTLLTNLASFNTGFGSYALDANTSGTNNTAIGYQALSAITTNNDCTAIGYQALLLNTGASNTAIGSSALDANTTGIQNVAIGKDALGANQTSSNNIGIGHNAGLTLTSAGGAGNNILIGSFAGDAALNLGYCIGIGSDALGAATNNSNCVALGYQALASITGINSNCTAVGYRAGILNTASDNTFIGSSAGDANSSGTRNTAVGRDALGAITTNSDCTAVGYNALILNTGQENTAVGSTALDACTSGRDNTAVGQNSLSSVVTGNNNTAVGQGSLATCTASDNTATGFGALFSNSSGTRNTAVGSGALAAIVTTNDTTALGYNAGSQNTAADNTFIGSLCGDANTSGTRNTAVGYNTLGSATTSGYNTAVGARALETLTTGAGGMGQNVAVGTYAGGGQTTGQNNVFIGVNAGQAGAAFSKTVLIGYNAGFSNTANDNVFIGSETADLNSTGTRNVAVGKDALGANTTSSDITTIGYQAGLLSTGASNTFVGSLAGDANTTGANNTGIGKDALGAITTSSDSTVLGYQAGLTTTGANNVFIGSGADGSAAARTNAIGIGKGVSVVADSTWVIGTIGIKQAIVEGANAAMGTATLGAGGTIVVNNNLVTANSRIFITSQDPNGGTQGGVFISARNAGVSFTITSTNAADTSIVAWEIKEPN